MARLNLFMCGVVGVASATALCFAAPAPQPRTPLCDKVSAFDDASFIANTTEAELTIDPTVFFQRLVDRYRGLHLYRDVIIVTQTTKRKGRSETRVETKIACEVEGDALKVKTPASQVRKSLGMDVPVKASEAQKDAQRKYDLWLAPHMALKFTDEPLKQLRAGVDEGFTATEVETVTIDNKKMVHVELRSGDGLSENSNATFDIYVNSDSMLIERIETEQLLPDGASYSTTLEITPEQAEEVFTTGPAT